MSESIEHILSKFSVVTTACPYGNGHINDTYFVGVEKELILQRINHNIFKEPEKVMENITAVTEFLKKKIASEGGDPLRETLTVIKTLDGCSLYHSEDGNYYRMYRFIRGALSYDSVGSSAMLYEAARAFGRFTRMLHDFPADTLHEILPGFHNTSSRFSAFFQATEEDKFGRAEKAKELIRFVLERKNYCGVIVNALENGSIPLRVTHNDTKLNNVLLDTVTGKGVCVIDLDTVMPGSLLFDFGDAIRFGANHGAEDDKNLDNVYCDMEMYSAFRQGYLEELQDSITEKEKELLPFSAIVMSLECGMRFLTDYLNGDTYFKIHEPEHNFFRAAAQLKLVLDMEQKFGIHPGLY